MKYPALIIGFIISLTLGAQDTAFVQAEVRILADSSFHGRGYVKDGSNIAAEYLKKRFEEIGLEPASLGYFQKFEFAVNTFENPVFFAAGDSVLKEGYDYIADPRSGSDRGSYDLQRLDSTHFQSSDKLPDTRGKVPVIDMTGMDTPEEMTALHELKLATLGRYPMVLLEPQKLMWSVGQQDYPKPVFHVLKSAFPEKAKKINIDLRPVEMDFKASNVIGKIPGRRSDSCVVITAHYDHLGRFGNALFAGASDNASGVATMLDIAAHYSTHEPEFDIWFVAFAAEEAGLLGSKFYVDNPVFPLQEIRLLINIDLMGSAANGITVVNGRLYPEMMSTLASINTEGDLLPKIKLRGKAANSDHYWFSEAGVPAIFIYTEGNITAYHDVYDRPEVLDWANYPALFTLLTSFINAL